MSWELWTKANFAFLIICLTLPEKSAPPEPEEGQANQFWNRGAKKRGKEKKAGKRRTEGHSGPFLKCLEKFSVGEQWTTLWRTKGTWESFVLLASG